MWVSRSGEASRELLYSVYFTYFLLMCHRQTAVPSLSWSRTADDSLQRSSSAVVIDQIRRCSATMTGHLPRTPDFCCPCWVTIVRARSETGVRRTRCSTFRAPQCRCQVPANETWTRLSPFYGKCGTASLYWKSGGFAPQRGPGADCLMRGRPVKQLLSHQ